MAEEIRADAGELAELAAETLAASDRLGERYRTGFAALAVPSTAFGDTVDAGDAHLVTERLLTDSQVAVATLVAVLDGDADRLYRTAFNYRQADRHAADRTGQARAGGL